MILSWDEIESFADDGQSADACICRNSAVVNVPGTLSLGLRLAEFVRNGGVGLKAGEEVGDTYIVR